MKLPFSILPILLALWVTGTAGYYHERIGERRDGLPMPFGFSWFSNGAQNAGSYVRNAVSEADVKTKLANTKKKMQPVATEALEMAPRVGNTISQADLDAKLTEFKDTIEPWVNEISSTAGMATKQILEKGQGGLDKITPEVKIAVVDRDVLGEVKPVNSVALVDDGTCPLREHLASWLDGMQKVMLALVERIVTSFAEFLRWFKEEYEHAENWARANPHEAIVISIMGFGIAMMLAPGMISGPALQLVGFGPEGVMARSIAAFIHSMIGDVMAGSGFAVLQSAGAGGYGAAIVNSAIQGGGAVVTSAGVCKLLDDLIKEQM